MLGVANANLISCNFLSLLHPNFKPHNNSYSSLSLSLTPTPSSLFHKPSPSLYHHHSHSHSHSHWRRITPTSPYQHRLYCLSSTSEEDEGPQKNSPESDNGGGGDWTTSFVLFLFWAALMYYVFFLSPNQTPSRDMYFLKKLCNLVEDDGFRMNQVLVSLWYIMGLWPVAYCMLLIPSGRSSKSSIPVWPFATLSFFGGAYALFPYFILWKPPPPPVKESELSSWPLNFLESKIAAAVLGTVGLGLLTYAGLAQGDWKEFIQYFKESKLVHATSLDFTLLSVFAPFWVYNDMTARKCYDKTAWLLPLAIIPFLGPALYLLLRPPLTTMPVPLESTLKSD